MDAPHLATVALAERTAGPLVLPWPTDTPGGFISFETPGEWRAFVTGLSLTMPAPEVVSLKYGRAQLLFLMGWTDPGLFKVSELVAFTALELALRDSYAVLGLARGLKAMVELHGLTDTALPLVQRSGGSVVGSLMGTTRPSLADRRNSLAHGDPFDGLPVSGLLELIRDLISYMYGRHITS